MNAIYDALGHQLKALATMAGMLSNEQYTTPIAALGQATVGQHSRHVVELLQCLQAGYTGDRVNYDLRKRSITLETDRDAAIAAIEELLMGLHQPDKTMVFEAQIGDAAAGISQVSTTYHRELVYNIEHAIHHMALIKVALYQFGFQGSFLETFGVAYATMQYRSQCAP